ncbi:MAG TPA: hypothetical protein VIV11_37775 [Kofleriaceae bacterium]
MKEVNPQQLMLVMGGASSVAQKKSDQQLELVISKLGNDIKELGRPKQDQNQQAMQLAMVVALSRRA